jgi:hypothetical protein
MERFMEIVKKMNKDDSYEFKTKIDEIDLQIIIMYEVIKLTMDKKEVYGYKLIVSSNYIDYIPSYHEYKFITQSYEDIPELYKAIETLKDMKWCKISGAFTSDEIMNKNREFRNVMSDLFELNKCSVCLDHCEELLNCDHILCMKCRSHMLKKKNKKCPICRNPCLHRDGESGEEE